MDLDAHFWRSPATPHHVSWKNAGRIGAYPFALLENQAAICSPRPPGVVRETVDFLPQPGVSQDAADVFCSNIPLAGPRATVRLPQGADLLKASAAPTVSGRWGTSSRSTTSATSPTSTT